MKSKPKAVIFDVFNTLFHNEAALWKTTFAEICLTQGLPLDGATLWARWKALEVDFRKHRTNLEHPENNPPFKSYEQAWRGCFEQVFKDLGDKGNAAAAAKQAVRDMGRRESFPETSETLSRLRSRVRLAVLSNADDAFLLPLIERHDLGFEAVLSSEAAGAYKPHPKPFRLILEKISLEPQEAMFVGDQLFDDILGAGSAGMATVWINRNGEEPDPELPRPDYAIANLMELVEIVNSTQAGAS